MLTERVHSLWRMLGLPQIALSSEQIPYPCVGTVNVARMSAVLLCFALWLARRATTLSRCNVTTVREDVLQLCPCFVVPLLPGECDAWKETELPIELATAVQLAEFDRAIFACEMRPEERELLIRFSPLCPQRQDLYTLRSRPPRETAKFT